MLPIDRESQRRRLIAVASCIIIGILLGVWHNYQTSRGRSDIITNTIRTVTTPFANAISATGGWIARQTGWIFAGKGVAEENARLKRENGALLEQANANREAIIANDRLRKQLGFANDPKQPRLAAEVVSRHPFPKFETIIISRGSRDGVDIHNVVVSAEGLIGQVYDVSSTTSAVLLITDTGAAVGAMVQRAESRAVGVVKGNGSASLNLNYLAKDADVKVGDEIITSGMGGPLGVFPKGIVIGSISHIKSDASGSDRIITVKPAVALDHLEEVFILR
ncbi:MAG: rod shape-determining protein MreC [Chthonomonadales bacterium]